MAASIQHKVPFYLLFLFINQTQQMLCWREYLEQNLPELSWSYFCPENAANTHTFSLLPSADNFKNCLQRYIVGIKTVR